MRAIEFIATAKKGTIEIPKEHQKNLHGKFRVIILQESTEETTPFKKRSLTAVKIKTKGLKFSRDEANER